MRWSRLVFRNLRQRPSRTAVSVASVAIGVAAFLSVSIGTSDLTESIVPRGERSLLQGSVTLAPSGVFDATAPASVVEPIRALPGVASAEGVTLTTAALVRGEESLPITLSAASAMPEVELGRAPTPGAPEIIVGIGLAEVGEVLRLFTADGMGRDVEVTGVVTSGGHAGWLAMTSLDTYGAWTGSANVVHRVIVGLHGGIDAETWLDEHEHEIGPLQPAGSASSDNAVAFFRSVQDGFAPLAASSLFVAGYLIVLMLGRAVQDRARTLATLRALGTSRGQLVGTIFAEAAAIAVAGTVIGLAIGSILGPVVTSVLRSVFGITITGGGTLPSISTSTLLTSIALGLVTPVAAAVLPALRAFRSDPAVGLRGEGRDASVASPGRVVLGAGLFALGTLMTVAVPASAKPATSLLALIGAAVALPSVGRPIGSAISVAWARLRPGPGELAAQEMARRPGRSAQTTALVTATLMVTVIIATLNASQRPGFLQIVDAHYGATADVYGPTGTGVTDAQLAELDADPAVAAFSPGARGTVQVLGSEPHTAPLSVIDPDTYFAVADLPWTTDTDPEVAVAGLGHGQVALAAAVAERAGVDAGDRVSLRTLNGPADFQVAGIYHGLGWGETVAVTVSDDLARQAFGLQAPAFVRVDLEHGIDTAGWSTTAPGYVIPTSAIRANVIQSFDGITNIALSLLVVTVVVGILGLANTLAMDTLDRRTEIGLLQALGLHRHELRSMVIARALVLTTVAGVLAVILGSVLGAAFVTGARADTLATPMILRLPTRAVPAILVASMLVGLLAAITPARLATRMQPADALRLPVEI